MGAGPARENSAMLTLTNHWVDQARKVPSPNFNARPDPEDISLVVIHNISLPPEEFGGPQVEAFFQNRLDPSEHPSAMMKRATRIEYSRCGWTVLC